MLLEWLVDGLSLEVWLVVDVVVSILWVPVWITHLILLKEILLWSPLLGAAVWVLLRWEVSLVLWDEHLIFDHAVMDTVIHLIFEPGVWYTQVIIWLHSDWKLSRNWIPRVLVHLPDGGVSEDHLGHFIVGTRWPHDFDLFTLGVGDNLSSKVSLVTFIEHIKSVVDNEVAEVNLFLWGEAQLLNSKGFLSGEAWGSSHDLLDISGLGTVIPRHLHVTDHLLDVFHSVWTIVWWDWTRLSNWVNMSHVVEWWSWAIMH